MKITLSNLLSVIVRTPVIATRKIKEIIKLRVIDRATVSNLRTSVSSVCKSIFDCATVNCVTGEF
jgi:hypothetical protein